MWEVKEKKMSDIKGKNGQKPEKYEPLRSRTGRVRTLVIRPLKCVSSLREAVKKSSSLYCRAIKRGGGGKGPKVPMAIKPDEGGGG